MLSSALWLVIETIGSLLATACVLRAWSGWAHVHPRNPLAVFSAGITDWLVRPIRRVVPSARGIDWAALVAALVLALVLVLVQFLLFGGLDRVGRVPSFGAMVLIAFLRLARWTALLLLVMTILQAVLSWVNPYAPIAPALEQLTRPFLAPIRRVLPLVAGVDLSPLVLILVVQFLMTLIDSALLPLGLAGR